MQKVERLRQQASQLSQACEQLAGSEDELLLQQEAASARQAVAQAQATLHGHLDCANDQQQASSTAEQRLAVEREYLSITELAVDSITAAMHAAQASADLRQQAQDDLQTAEEADDAALQSHERWQYALREAAEAEANADELSAAGKFAESMNMAAAGARCLFEPTLRLSFNLSAQSEASASQLVG